MDDPMDRRCPLRTLNEMITCKICHGYLIDATTGNILGHSFSWAALFLPKVGLGEVTNKPQFCFSNRMPAHIL